MKESLRIKNELSKERNNRCSVCGKIFPSEDLFAEHIVPLRFGGKDDADNCILVCRRCNDLAFARNFSESELEKFVLERLRTNSGFRNVKNACEKIGKYLPDILAERKNGDKWEKIFIEVIGVPSLSQARISYVSEQMNEMREINGGVPVLAIAGRLAETSRSVLENGNIEIWDEDRLAELSYESGMNFSDEEEIVEPVPVRTRERELIDRLKACPTGKSAWGIYQKLVGEILECLFYPVLSAPISQKEDVSRTNRRDYILPNYCETGFWAFMRNAYHADFIVADAKNNSKEISKDDVLQVLNYLKEHGAGMFGLIIGRKGASRGADVTLREAWASERKLVLILDDNDIEQMLIEKGSARAPELVIRQKIEDFRLSI